MSKEAMELAQKWQQTNWNTENPMSADFAVSEANDVISALMDALREALAEQPAQQEPVGEVSGHDWSTGILYRDLEPGAPLYTSPQPAQRKPLTKDQIAKFYGGDSPIVFQIIRDVEAALGITGEQA